MDEEYGTDTTYCIVLEKDGTFYSLYMNGIDEPFATDGTWERASDGFLSSRAIRRESIEMTGSYISKMGA